MSHSHSETMSMKIKGLLKMQWTSEFPACSDLALSGAMGVRYVARDKNHRAKSGIAFAVLS